MSIWLVLALALVLVPLVRVFMADGCASAPAEPAHGTHPLRISVNVNNHNPIYGQPDGDATLTGGRVVVQPPSGSSLPEIVVPPAGLVGHEVPVTPEMFGSGAGPYEWQVRCSLEFNATRPVPGRSAVGTVPTFWNANADRHLYCTLQLLDREGTLGGVPTHDLAWVIGGG
jgi:hypothetical protein